MSDVHKCLMLRYVILADVYDCHDSTVRCLH